MSVWQVIGNSLRHHWRIHAAVAFGVAAATAVLTGALIIGDSVRGSLRHLVLDRLGKEISSALDHPSTRERLNTLGVELKGSTRDELRSFMRGEVERWGAIARQAGVVPE